MTSMAHWYPLASCDETYFHRAPHVYRFAVELPVSPERVWASLVSPHSVADWTRLLASIEWTSELGLGATRTVVLPGRALSIHEHFFRWEEGRRFSFYGLEASRPLLGRFAEDYLVEPSGTGARFTWTFALEGKRGSALPLKLLSPGNALLFHRMAHGAKRYFAN
jgi:Polyketide cyclase / dehydrase and lipid transport